MILPLGGASGLCVATYRCSQASQSLPNCRPDLNMQRLFRADQAAPRGRSPDSRDRSLGCNPHRKSGITVHKVRRNSLGFADNLDFQSCLQNLLPEDFQLQLRKMSTNAAMDPKSERKMLPHVPAVDDEALGVLDDFIVAVS